MSTTLLSRIFLACIAALCTCCLLGCALAKEAAAQVQPLPTVPTQVVLDSLGRASVHPVPVKRGLFGWLKPATNKRGKFKNKGTIIYQVGQNNTATAATVTKPEAPAAVGEQAQATDNSKSGQKGGAATTGDNSPATATTQKGGLPLWLVGGAVVVAFLIGGALGWVGRSKLSILLLLCCLLPVTSQAETPNPRRYSYRVARQTERKYRRVVRYYNHKNRQNARELKRDRKIQAKRLLRDHP